MAINSVDLTKALNNEAYAAQVIRSGKCDSSERFQIAAQWGNEKIAKWESVDSTQYEISDDQKDAAIVKGSERVEEAAKTDKDGNVNNKDFDGKADNGKSKAIAATAATVVGGAAAAIIAFGPKAVWGAMTNGWIALAMAGALLAMALVVKSLDPNSEQAQACDNLKSEFDEAEGELGEIKDEVSEKANEITDKTDKLMAKTEEKQDAEAAYTAKKDSFENQGTPLTEQQKAGLTSAYNDVTSKAGESADMNEELNDNIEQSEELFDSEGEKLEEVQAMTDYQAEFDEDTVDNADFVKMAGYVGVGASAGVAAGAAIHSWKIFSGETAASLAAIAMSGVAGVKFGEIIGEQNDYKERAEAGVDNRHHLEDVNAETTEQYEEDLDTYAADIDFKKETEPNIALTVEDPNATQATEAESGTSDSATQVNPFAPNNNKSDETTNSASDDSNQPDEKVDKDEEV